MSHHHHKHTKRYALVWTTLLVLTVITVSVAGHNFGNLNIFIAMLIATVKAVLVCLFFMHLLEDNRLNQVVFVTAFVFLAIFVALTASDELVRPVFSSATVKVIAEPASDIEAMKKLMTATPELVEHGKTVFAAQCATCPGASGKGDAAAAAALNPKPRDFTSGYWKFGGEPSHVFNTISKGSPGTAMAPFDTLSVKDRWALVHYVRSLSPSHPDDTDETIKSSGLFPAAGAEKKETAVPELPVGFVIERMVNEGK